ncbi:MAG: hypothetical protein KBG67_03120 [Candidatus Atribacteria bacterium]|nr:hypothetical protein [Candidatus Atribacteria bacterium]
MKIASVLCISIVILAFVFPAYGQDQVASPLVKDLEEMERILYGVPETGSVLTRTENLERDLIGDTLSGTLMERLNTLKTFILTGTPEEPSLDYKLKAIRLSLNIAEQKTGILTAQLDEYEQLIFGVPSAEPIGVRVDKLYRTVVNPSFSTNFQVTIPVASLVKVSIQTSLNSEKNNLGDPVPYILSEDFIVNDILVAPAGTEGEGWISKIRRKGNFGKSGMIQIDFGSITSLDGTSIPLTLGDKAVQENKAFAYAVGTSIVGLVALGPIGAVAGFLINGEPAKVESGSILFVETAQEVVVSGPIASSVSYQTYEGQGYPTPEIDDTYGPSPDLSDQNVPEVEIEVKPVESWDTEEDLDKAVDVTSIATPIPIQSPKPSPTSGIDIEIKPYQEGDF